ncbi:MAG: hypothetical protein HOD63_10835 [Bacteroidetes bacterium]|jgi:hypothetical protein|nr:hypothetical protein [Bacteroidota bacterium]MBT5529586.1 hypothetical protein [Cytophagia bacterium]MBT3423320.1 hypothetical protein [Bacteroidota bacterium]MBT3802502.1 hypothetical protein [Bacteroidota bacterium]MBT3935397.1 hypothetical protein [Bacteroidota bacterium]
MKKNNVIFSIFSLLMVAGIVFFMSCTTEGPEGPMGPAGVDGINGTDGTDGVDGNAVCLTCHNLANKAAKETEYEKSQHAEAEFVGYAGGRQGCAMCHSHEGMLESLMNGGDTTNSTAGIAYPTAISCATCHDFHATLDFENDGDDYALRNDGPIDFLMARADGGSEIADFGAGNNTCVKCHQPRRSGPVADANDSFFVSSTHWGPHHGPQANTVYGWGMVEVAGAEAYPTKGSHAHFKSAGCVGCHMATATGDDGGHTFWPNLDNCKKCHSSATSFDYKGIQTDVMALLDQIEVKLEAIGVVHDGHPVKGTYHIDAANAAYNWIWLSPEDKSFGVHNPDYILAVLKNTLATL